MVDSDSRRCSGEERGRGGGDPGFGRSCRTRSQGGLSEVRAICQLRVPTAQVLVPMESPVLEQR